MLRFRRAKLEDLDAVARIFSEAVADMRRRGIDQWNEFYPNRDDLRADILRGEMQLGFLDEALACAWTVNGEFDEEYALGRWECPKEEFRVLHRLCVRPAFQHRGVARRAILHAQAELSKQGVAWLRLDVLLTNPFAVRLYRGLGFRVAGEFLFRTGRFCLMEKRLLDSKCTDQ